jgi:hypothetical protein
MSQAGRTMTGTDEGALADCRVLICDRDPKWSALRAPHAGRIEGTRGPDAVPSAKLQRARGALRAINQGGMPQPRDSDAGSGISGGLCTSSSSMTTATAIIRASTTSSSTVTRLPGAPAGLAVVSDSAACSTTITARHEGIGSLARSSSGILRPFDAAERRPSSLEVITRRSCRVAERKEVSRCSSCHQRNRRSRFRSQSWNAPLICSEGRTGAATATNPVGPASCCLARWSYPPPSSGGPH